MGDTRPPLLNRELTLMPWCDPFLSRLPGLVPIPQQDWWLCDDVFGPQMAYRDHLIANQPAVCQAQDGIDHILDELRSQWLAHIRHHPGYRVQARQITRPDGVTLDCGRLTPLALAGRLTQADILVLAPQPGRYPLIAGCLCFPAHWRLSDKLGRNLFDVHAPVADYTSELSQRVNRILDRLKPGQALMRANTLLYTNPDLHQPQPEGTPKQLTPGATRYVRVERQTFQRLPESRAIVFAIQTQVVAEKQVAPSARDALSAHWTGADAGIC